MKLIDLSHVLDENTPVFPGDGATRLGKHRELAAHGFNGHWLETALHTGTHVDVPMHFLDDARTVVDFPMEGFAGPGVLLDVRGQAVIGMREEYRRRVREGDVVLLWTGLDARYGQAEYFTRYPCVTDALTAFFVERGIKMLGMDSPSPDVPPNACHKALLGAGIFVLENLTHLERLAGIEAFEVMALPLKIAAEGSPVRAVGVMG